VYFINDGNVPQQLSVKGTAGNSKWVVRYLDYSTGADITAAVTGAGWQTPGLGPGAGRRLRVLVTPGPSVAVGGTLRVLVRGSSTIDGTRRDVVKATTTRK